MSKRPVVKQQINYYAKYLKWVKESDSTVLNKYFGIMMLSAIVLLTIATLIPFGGQWVQTIVAFPASLLFFVIALGLAHKQHLKTGALTVRERYSPSKRRKLGAILAVIALSASMFIAQYLPYAVGGMLLLLALAGIVNFIRTTPEEEKMEEAGAIDPRDLGINKEEPDILDDDFSWEDYDESDEEK